LIGWNLIASVAFQSIFGDAETATATDTGKEPLKARIIVVTTATVIAKVKAKHKPLLRMKKHELLERKSGLEVLTETLSTYSAF
jgi:hypothetical protein